jgi:hypothetical protein
MQSQRWHLDSILHNMKTKHLLVATFSMGLTVQISNTGLAFTVIHTYTSVQCRIHGSMCDGWMDRPSRQHSKVV